MVNVSPCRVAVLEAVSLSTPLKKLIFDDLFELITFYYLGSVLSIRYGKTQISKSVAVQVVSTYRFKLYVHILFMSATQKLSKKIMKKIFF